MKLNATVIGYDQQSTVGSACQISKMYRIQVPFASIQVSGAAGLGLATVMISYLPILFILVVLVVFQVCPESLDSSEMI